MAGNMKDATAGGWFWPFGSTGTIMRALLAGILLASTAVGADKDDPNHGVVFLYPTEDLVVRTMDTIEVTYTSPFPSPNLYAFCDGGSRQLLMQPVPGYNATVPILLNYTSATPCWFNLRPGTKPGFGANSPQFNILGEEREEGGKVFGVESSTSTSSTSSSASSTTTPTKPTTPPAAETATTTTTTNQSSSSSTSGSGVSAPTDSQDQPNNGNESQPTGLGASSTTAPAAAANSSGDGLSAAAAGGIGAGVAALVLAGAGGIFAFLLRRRRRRTRDRMEQEGEDDESRHGRGGAATTGTRSTGGSQAPAEEEEEEKGVEEGPPAFVPSVYYSSSQERAYHYKVPFVVAEKPHRGMSPVEIGTSQGLRLKHELPG
jgi:hypothetical protein